MKVVYRHYEPDQGLEDHQARIYTGVSGLPTSSASIRERNMRKDPRLIQYALTEAGTPLAYIQARDAQHYLDGHIGRTYIGYPWALPECPVEVQEKLFDKLFNYIRTREETVEIATTIVNSSKIAGNQIAFFTGKGFVEKEYFGRYKLVLDMKEVASWNIDNPFSVRRATEKDTDLLVELCHAIPYVRDSYPSRESCWRHYNSIIREQNTSVLIQGNRIIAAGAATNGNGEALQMNLSLVHPDYPQAWKQLLNEVAKQSITQDRTDVSLRAGFYFFAGSPAAPFLSSLRSDIEILETVYTYEQK